MTTLYTAILAQFAVLGKLGKAYSLYQQLLQRDVALHDLLNTYRACMIRVTRIFTGKSPAMYKQTDELANMGINVGCVLKKIESFITNIVDIPTKLI